jgi:hypothetical protein
LTRPDSRLTPAAAARIVVQASTLLAVAVGCWFLTPQPALALSVALAYGAGAIGARVSVDGVLTTLLLFAYTSTGLLLIISPAAASTPVWLAAFAGLVAGGTSWTRWAAPRAWQIPLMIWLVGIALSWPVIVARELDFSLASPRNAAGLILAVTVMHLALGLVMDTLFTWDARRIERRVAWPLLVSAILSAAVALYQGLIDITFLSDAPWTTEQRAIGLMADANPMAIVAAVWAPLAVVLFRTRGLLWAGVVTCLLLWSAAWFTDSRSIVLLIPASVGGLLIAALAAHIGTRRALIVTGAMAGVALTAAVIAVNAGVRASPASPIGRVIRTLPLASVDYLLYEALWRRDGYGLAAARAIAEHPLNGVGIGAFNALAPHYHRIVADTPLPADNAQNLWRHQLVERGLFGFVAVALFTIATVRLMMRQAPEHSRFTSWGIRGVLLGLGGVLMFGVPVQNAGVALTAVALLAWLHAIADSPIADAPSIQTNSIVLAAFALGLAGVALDAWSGTTTLRPAVRAARVGDGYAYGFGDEVVAPNGGRARIVERRATVAVPAKGKFLVQVWARGTSPHAIRVWSNGQLIIDDRADPSTMIERVLEIPVDRSAVLLEFWSEPPGLLVVGTPR